MAVTAVGAGSSGNWWDVEAEQGSRISLKMVLNAPVMAPQAPENLLRMAQTLDRPGYIGNAFGFETASSQDRIFGPSVNLPLLRTSHTTR